MTIGQLRLVLQSVPAAFDHIPIRVGTARQDYALTLVLMPSLAETRDDNATAYLFGFHVAHHADEYLAALGAEPIATFRTPPQPPACGAD